MTQEVGVITYKKKIERKNNKKKKKILNKEIKRKGDVTTNISELKKRCWVTRTYFMNKKNMKKNNHN
jgi:hypothetical protein